jgi:hypothetical protein
MIKTTPHDGAHRSDAPYPLKTWRLGRAGSPLHAVSVCAFENSGLFRDSDFEFGHRSGEENLICWQPILIFRHSSGKYDRSH